MKIKYSPEVDILTIELKEGKPVNSKDIEEGIIIHFSANNEPLEIEILDASKVAKFDTVDVSFKELLSAVK